MSLFKVGDIVRPHHHVRNTTGISRDTLLKIEGVRNHVYLLSILETGKILPYGWWFEASFEPVSLLDQMYYDSLTI